MRRARQILASLVEREVLIKTSKAQRGPTVEYGPGPDFPAPNPRRRRTATDHPDAQHALPIDGDDT